MKDLNLSDKKDILLSALNERYEAMRIIRERVQSICTWSLGLMLGAAGWLLQSDIFLSSQQKFLYLLGLGLAFWVLRYRYLDDLQRGFVSQQRVAVHIERILGLYQSKVYDESEHSVYPKKWEEAGSEKGDGKFFRSTYLLLYVGFLILGIAVLLYCGQPVYFWY